MSNLARDCRLAAQALADTNTFETGQDIFLDAADRIEQLEACVRWFSENTHAHPKNMLAVANEALKWSR